MRGFEALPARGVGLAELVAQALNGVDHAVLVAQDALDVTEELEVHAFFLGVTDFLGAGGHLGAATAVDEVDLLGAEAEGHARGISALS